MQTLNIPLDSQGFETRGADLRNIRTVLVKFAFTNQNHVPSGIPMGRVSWERQKEKEQANAVVAYSVDPKLGQEGRVSAGRVDTGVQVVNNLQHVQVAILRRGLANAGFSLRTIHTFYVAPKPDRRDPRRMTAAKYVVELVYTDEDAYEDATATEEERKAHKVISSPQVVEAIRALARTTWQWCHVWDNSRVSGTATVNVGGRLPEGKPVNAIAIRDRHIVPVQIASSLEEGEE